MSKLLDNLLTLTPMEDYEVPGLLALEEGKPELLMKMPSRWKNKVMIATRGLLGVTALTSCYEEQRQLHHGGEAINPIYVVHFTKQEALDMIRAQLEAAGLNFDNEVTPYKIEGVVDHRWLGNVGIDLFDKERNVAITLMCMYEDATSTMVWGQWLYGWEATEIETEFSEQHEEITFGVFYNPSRERQWRYREGKQPPTEEEIEILTEQLENQVQDFIQQLREDGVIE